MRRKTEKTSIDGLANNMNLDEGLPLSESRACLWWDQLPERVLIVQISEGTLVYSSLRQQLPSCRWYWKLLKFLATILRKWKHVFYGIITFENADKIFVDNRSLKLAIFHHSPFRKQDASLISYLIRLWNLGKYTIS